MAATITTKTAITITAGAAALTAVCAETRLEHRVRDSRRGLGIGVVRLEQWVLLPGRVRMRLR